MWFLLLSSFFLSFLPRLISAVGDWMSTILLHMVCLSANLECRSEMCCTRLVGNTRRKNDVKIAIWSPSHNLSGYIFATKACIDNRKKNLLSSNMFSTCPRNMVNFGPLAAEIVSLVWAYILVIAALRSRCGHYIFALWFLYGRPME